MDKMKYSKFATGCRGQ